MLKTSRFVRLLPALLLGLIATGAGAQSFQVQCPAGTVLHRANPALSAGITQAPASDPMAPHVVVGPDGHYYTYHDSSNNYYDTVTHIGRTDGLLNPTAAMANPHIKCQQISGGDGFATMGDGTQTYLFAFGPLSGFGDMVKGLGGTEPSSVFNQDTTLNLDAVKIGAPVPHETFNGAVGLVPDPESVTLPNELNGHVDPRQIMDVGTMNGNFPAPMFVIDEGDEFFLTLTNVGMVMRPDLFEQHTVHFHGYPNASAFYDGVPDASVAINIGASFTYYYLAPEAGTYMWHCHISPPEHLQMGMVGQLYVRPKQNVVASTTDLGASLKAANQTSFFGVAAANLPNVGTGCNDILCTDQTPLPPTANPTTGATGAFNTNGQDFAYNDGDGSTAYDVDYPLNMHGFDPNFHFVGMTFNPESFTDNKDKYFMLNGRSYPDTVGGYVCGWADPSVDDPLPACHNDDGSYKGLGAVVAGPMSTQSADGTLHVSQPQHALINIPVGGKALLRISDLNVTEFHTLASLGIRMRVVGKNARLLRDLDGANMAYDTNSITLGGGESLDVILDASKPEYAACTVDTPCTFYLYTPQLDHLSNDAENFGGMMTEVRVGPST
jgi:Multicopper oxidase